MTEDIKPPPTISLPATTIVAGIISHGYPTKLSSVTVRYPHSSGKGQAGLAQFLQVNKDKEKNLPKKEESGSLSGSDHTNPDVALDDETATNAATIFSQNSTKHKKNASRPKHNIRTTSSTFVSRIQHAEGHAKALAAKQGEVTFLFYNTSKNFVWMESGSKAKVCNVCMFSLVLVLNCTRIR